MTKAVHAVILVGLAALTTGCYESTEVTEFEPGIYKGQSDPLLDADSEQRAETLEQRFNTVQAAE